ncbi:MAG: aminoacyl-tRNA deacylase [Planctomycetota bacterium]
MAAKPKSTPATLWLRKHGVPFEPHSYDYVDRGGAARSAEQLGVPLEQVVKTLVLTDESGEGLLMLLPGDRELSLKGLARTTGRKTLAMAKPEQAHKWTGYLFGGTSPFGTRRNLPTFVHPAVLEFERIWINGGGRGYLVEIDPAVLTGVLGALVATDS